MAYRIFVINPGSTSTKLALFEDETCVESQNIFHDSTILRQFSTINDQLEYRMDVMRTFLKEKQIDLTGIDAIVGRGGSSYSVESGVYEVDETLLRDTRESVGGLHHVSNLGIQMGKRIRDEYGGRLFMVDPTVVDEFQDLARVTGVKGVYRRSILHALNQKATAKKHAELTGQDYEKMNYIVCHIDGGITIHAHEKGRMIDGNNGGGGDGPFTPTRMGGMAVTEWLESLYDKTKEEMRSLCMETGGLSSHFGTSNADTIHAMVEEGQPHATLIWRAMIYQVCKQIGAMAAVLKGKVDAIILTGGLLRFDDVADMIREYCGFIAPVAVYPGELEFEAMAKGALDVLRGKIEPRKYTGRPVFEGFDFDR